MGLLDQRAGCAWQAQGLDLNTHHRHVHGPQEDRLWGQASVLMFASYYSLFLLLVVAHSPSVDGAQRWPV